MKKTVLFVILDQFADYEYPFLAAALNDKVQGKSCPYEVKTLSVTKDPVKSMGGFTVLPDYSPQDCPKDYTGIILIGGHSWRTCEAQEIAPLVRKAYTSGKVVGAICDATVFLGGLGLLNHQKHTGNTLEDLMAGAKNQYTGRDCYVNEQAVRDGNLVTANGTAHMEFTKEVLTALDAYPAAVINDHYAFYKLGFIETMKRFPTI